MGYVTYLIDFYTEYFRGQEFHHHLTSRPGDHLECLGVHDLNREIE